MNHFFSTAFILLFVRLSYSAEPVRPRHVYDYINSGVELTMEDSVPVEGAFVAWANFDLIRFDFPQLKNLNNIQISNWLLKNFAYVAKKQLQLNDVRNSPFRTLIGPSKHAFRPPGWVRSAILEAFDPNNSDVIGMVDIKGFGHGERSMLSVESQLRKFKEAEGNQRSIDLLRLSDHSDGLMSLGEGVAETSRQIVAQMLFDMSGMGLETVENYALISLPVDILKDGEKQIPAGLLLRQAHIGRNAGLNVPYAIYIDHHGGRQMTLSGSAVDFGGVIVKDDRLKQAFMALDYHEHDPQMSLPWKYGHETAKAVVDGSTSAIYDHIKTMTARIQDDYNRSDNATNARRHRLAIQRYVSKLYNKGFNLVRIIYELNTLKRVKSGLAGALSFESLKQSFTSTSETVRDSALKELVNLRDKERKIELYRRTLSEIPATNYLATIIISIKSNEERVDIATALTSDILNLLSIKDPTLKEAIFSTLALVNDQMEVGKILAKSSEFDDNDFSFLADGILKSDKVSADLLKLCLDKGKIEVISSISRISDEEKMGKIVREIWNSEQRQILIRNFSTYPYKVIGNIMRIAYRLDDKKYMNGIIYATSKFTESERLNFLLPLVSNSMNLSVWFPSLDVLRNCNDPRFLKLLDRFLNTETRSDKEELDLVSRLRGRTDSVSQRYLIGILDHPKKEIQLRIDALRFLDSSNNPLAISRIKKYAFISNPSGDSIQLQQAALAVLIGSNIEASVEEIVKLFSLPKESDTEKTQSYAVDLLTRVPSPKALKAARRILQMESINQEQKRKLGHFVFIHGEVQDLDFISLFSSGGIPDNSLKDPASQRSLIDILDDPTKEIQLRIDALRSLHSSNNLLAVARIKTYAFNSNPSGDAIRLQQAALQILVGRNIEANVEEIVKLFSLPKESDTEKTQSYAVDLLTRVPSPKAVRAARNILQQGSIDEKQKQKLARFVIIHGEVQDLDSIGLMSSGRIREDYLDALLWRKKDSAALRYFNSALPSITSRSLILQIIGQYGNNGLDLSQLRRNPNLDSTIKLKIYVIENPPSSFKRCQNLL